MTLRRIRAGVLTALVFGAWTTAANAGDTMRLTIKGDNIDAQTQTLGGETADTLEAAYRAAYGGGYRGGAVGFRAGSVGYRAGYVGFRAGYVGYRGVAVGYRGFAGYRGVGGYRGGFFGYPWGGYGGYWGGWRGYGYYRPWLGAGLAFGVGYSPAYYPYYGVAPAYLSSPSFYSSAPCTCASGLTMAPLQQNITLESAPPGYAVAPEQLNVAPRQVPYAVQPERLVPLPRSIPNDGTYQYDGGPSSPVPLPRPLPTPTTVPPTAGPTPNRVVSMPKNAEKPSKFAYSAYGEDATKTNFAADRATPDTRKIVAR